MPRNAWVIQITPVRLTRTTANDASVVRKIYLSIDPITPERSPPRSRTRGLTTIPNFGFPYGCAACRPTGLVCHYHPVDPSTKWPRDGTPFSGWLINPLTWLAGHGALQRRDPQAIVPGKRLADGGLWSKTAFPAGFPTRRQP